VNQDVAPSHCILQLRMMKIKWRMYENDDNSHSFRNASARLLCNLKSIVTCASAASAFIMPDHLGEDMRKEKKKDVRDKDEKIEGQSVDLLRVQLKEWQMVSRMCFMCKYTTLVDDTYVGCAALDEGDIAVLKRYGQGPYSAQIKQLDDDITACIKRVSDLTGAYIAHYSCLIVTAMHSPCQ